jgi:hypothetical protein
MIAFFGIAIARAWDLLGGPATGLLGTVQTLVQQRTSREADERPATGRGAAMPVEKSADRSPDDEVR